MRPLPLVVVLGSLMGCTSPAPPSPEATLAQRLGAPVRLTSFTPMSAPNAGSTPGGHWGYPVFAQLGEVTVFGATDALHGGELWRTDGTAAGTFLLRDVRPGPLGSLHGQGFTTQYASSDGLLLFTADDGRHGVELWRTDGTTAGTTLLADLTPGARGSLINYPTRVGDGFFFNLGQDLWRTDGTAAGTKKVRAGVDLRGGVDFKGALYFAGFFTSGPESEAVLGLELFRSDGTEAGTVLMMDLCPGLCSSYPGLFTVAGDTLYFRNNTGEQLWRSDGTAAGTVRFATLPAGLVDANSFTFVGTTLFFVPIEQSSNRRQLWKTDGTQAGTVRVKDLAPGQYPVLTDLVVLGDALYFRADDGVNGRELWRSDGTEAGTTPVTDLGIGTIGGVTLGPVRLGDGLLFTGNDGLSGAEPYFSDGTLAGTARLADIAPQSSSSQPMMYFVAGGTAFFSANDVTHGAELWKTDGTPAGTLLVKDVNGPQRGSRPSDLVAWEGGVLFAAEGPQGRELWRSDGTVVGTRLVRDISPGAGSSSPAHLTALRGQVYFAATEPTTGTELWRTDGTDAGTVLVANVVPNSLGASPTKLTLAAGTLLFSASNRAHAVAPDGGVVLLFDSDVPNEPLREIAPSPTGAWFVGQHAYLWRLFHTDGTPQGTRLVADLAPPPYTPRTWLVDLDGRAVFSHRRANDGIELWTSDGTDAGIALVKEFIPGSFGGSPEWLTVANGELYFAASSAEEDRDLWRSDGTAAGTVRALDLFAGGAVGVQASGEPSFLKPVWSEQLLLIGDLGAGNRLLVTDGTDAGTRVLTEAAPVFSEEVDDSYGSGGPGFFEGGLLAFAAATGESGSEPWVSQGFAATTAALGDLHLGVGSSNPHSFVRSGNKLFFAADDGAGYELWVVELSPTSGGEDGGTGPLGDGGWTAFPDGGDVLGPPTGCGCEGGPATFVWLALLGLGGLALRSRVSKV